MTRVLLVLALSTAALIVSACASGEPPTGAKPGTVWSPSATGLPTFYVFSDPS
jgi:hypothetical protein